MQVIYHIVVWLLFHKVVQNCDIRPYMSMISSMLHLLWWGKLFAPHRLSYCAWKKGHFFANLPLNDGVKLVLKGCVNLTRFCLYLQQRALID
jgi:hypothetical protein